MKLKKCSVHNFLRCETNSKAKRNSGKRQTKPVRKKGIFQLKEATWHWKMKTLSEGSSRIMLNLYMKMLKIHRERDANLNKNFSSWIKKTLTQHFKVGVYQIELEFDKLKPQNPKFRPRARRLRIQNDFESENLNFYLEDLEKKMLLLFPRSWILRNGN